MTPDQHAALVELAADWLVWWTVLAPVAAFVAGWACGRRGIPLGTKD